MTHRKSRVLDASERLFAEYRDRPVAILAIGLEQADSLETWKALFPNATILDGCVAAGQGVGPERAETLISALTGDGVSQSVGPRHLARRPIYDIIVDAGHDHVRNAVQTFATYFPLLRDGGLYIADDIHCSPWMKFGGGLFNPFSARAFFRRLADVVSMGGCDMLQPRARALAALATYQGVTLDEATLSALQSVEFLGSACVVRRKEAGGLPALNDVASLDLPLHAASEQPPGEGAPSAAGRADGAAVAQLSAYRSAAVWPLLRVLLRLERRWPRVARGAVAIPRLAWWVLSLQLPARLQLRRQAREILQAGLFDADWYLRRYPAVANSEEPPLLNWLTAGWRAGRDPHPGFNSADYVRENPDVAASGLNPVAHYLRIGRAEGRLIRTVGDEYPEWVRRYDSLTEQGRDAIRVAVARMAGAPLLSLLMPIREPSERWLRAAIESVIGQLYPHWELCIADDASAAPHVRRILEEYAAQDTRVRIATRSSRGGICAACNTALTFARGDFVALFDQHDLLPEHALYAVASELLVHPGADIVYSDQDCVDATASRHDPFFKPDFNLELLCSQSYLGRLGFFRRSLVAEVDGFRTGLEGAYEYDLALRCVARSTPVRIRHVPRILYHRRAKPKGQGEADAGGPHGGADGVYALSNFFRSRGEIADVARLATGGYRVRFPLPEPHPLVSIIVPTRNKADLLRVCLSSVLDKTTYPAYEVIVVDNRSDEPSALSYLDELRGEPRCRVLAFDAPFNYSAINNLAVREAHGEFVVLLNNDTEVITPDWLDELVMWGSRNGVGAVGAKLRYPDRTIQHAGILLGVRGNASHHHKHASADDIGYFGRLASVHEVGGNTAACLLVRREHYVAVGGLDEENLPVSFNDVDLCLRLRSAGLRNVWTPHAELFHHESKSRGREASPDAQARALAECAYLSWRWGAQLVEDPAYNPNLTLEREDFSLAWPPRLAPLSAFAAGCSWKAAEG